MPCHTAANSAIDERIFESNFFFISFFELYKKKKHAKNQMNAKQTDLVPIARLRVQNLAKRDDRQPKLYKPWKNAKCKSNAVRKRRK